MAVYFAPPDPSGSAGIGASMGKSLQKTLMMLTQNKMLQQQQQQQQQQMMQMQEQQKQRKASDVAQGLNAMGLPPEISEQISSMPESQQNMFMKQFFGSQAFGAAQEGVTGQLEEGLQTVEGADQLQQLLGPQMQQAPQGGAPQEAPEMPEADQVALAEQMQAQVDNLSPEDKKALKTEIDQAVKAAAPMEPKVKEMKEPSISTADESKISSAINKLPAGKREEARSTINNALSGKEGKVISDPPIPVAAKSFGNIPKLSVKADSLRKVPAGKKTFQELLMTPRPTASDKRMATDIAYKEGRLETMKGRLETQKGRVAVQKQNQINAATKAYYDDTLKSAKGATKMNMLLAKQKALIKKGNLSSPLVYNATQLSKKLKAPLDFLLSEDSQVFQKIMQDYSKGAKDYYGGNMTQGELDRLMETVPSLAQTRGAKLETIRNNKLTNEMFKLKFKVMNEVIEMNGGERPANMGMIVETRAAPLMKKLTERFSKPRKEVRLRIKAEAEAASKRGPVGKVFHGIESVRKYLSSGVKGFRGG